MSGTAGTLISMCCGFGLAGLGVLITQGQSTWLPQNHWLAPLLFGTSAVCLVLSIPAVRNSIPRMRFYRQRRFPTFRIVTAQMLNRYVEMGFRPKVIRIGKERVSDNDLPRHIHIDGCHLTIKKFQNSGVLFDEQGTVGLIVDIELLEAG